MGDIIVIIKHKDANEISQMVRDLKSQGYRLGIDFDFAYSPGNWDPMTGNIPRQTKFIFYNEHLGFIFQLKE